MKAKLTIDGKEFEVDISEEQAKALTETKKKTGYERVRPGEIYYIGTVAGTSACNQEDNDEIDDSRYECANYYSDVTIAKNNARADKLYRQLRRFAVEHRKEEIDWNNNGRDKFYLYYIHNEKKIDVAALIVFQDYGNIYFDTKESAHLAIEAFKDDLIWYFTEYKDSL